MLREMTGARLALSAATVALALLAGHVAVAQDTAPDKDAAGKVREYVAPDDSALKPFDPLAGLEMEDLRRRVSELESSNEQLREAVSELYGRVKALEKRK